MKPVVKFQHDSVRIDGEFCYEEDLCRIADDLITNQSVVRDQSVDSGAPDYQWEFEYGKPVVVSINPDVDEIPLQMTGEIDLEATDYRGYHVPRVTISYLLCLFKFEIVDETRYAFYDLGIED